MSIYLLPRVAIALPVCISFHLSQISNILVCKIRWHNITVKILKIRTPEIITIIVLQLEQLDFTVQYCVQKMQTE